MNAILQQRIIEAKQKEYPLPPMVYGAICKAIVMVEQTAYTKGATFALQNQWISVDEALPEFEGNFSDYCIIRTEDGFCAVTMYYRTSEKEYWWNFEKVKVTHWMQIPSLKGGEE